MEIYLVRHTKVALEGDICYGISDVDLAESWQADFQKVKNKLAGITFDKIYTSPLKRCKLLAESHSDDFLESDDLKEMNFGSWELKPWREIGQKTIDIWMDDFVNQCPEGGESYMDFSMKSVFFFDKLTKGLPHGKKVLLTTHAGVIRAITCHVLNLSLAHSFNFDVDYGSVTKIEVRDGWHKIRHLNY